MLVSEATVVKVPTVPSPSSQALHCLLEPGTARLAGPTNLSQVAASILAAVCGDMLYVCVCGGVGINLTDYWGRLCVPRYAILELSFFIIFLNLCDMSERKLGFVLPTCVSVFMACMRCTLTPN